MATNIKNIPQSTQLAQVSADILSEFLEVAFHTILYIRELYPATAFHRRKKYNVPVQMCYHPEVAAYVTELLESLKQLVSTRRLHKVALVVLDERLRPLERFTFEIAPPVKTSTGDDTYLLRLEQSLRAFLLKLNTCDALLQPNNNTNESTWTVLAYTTDDAVIDMQQASLLNDFTWLEADQKLTKMDQPILHPLKALDSSVVKMQLYVEESRTK